MSSQSLQSLQLLLERAEQARDQARLALQEAQTRAAATRQQHGELAQYRSDYQLRWTQSFARTTTVDILGCYQSFGGKLDQAIDQQGQLQRHAEQGEVAARASLMQCEMRVASIQKLLERRVREWQRLGARREQMATDEQAARASTASPFTRIGG